MGEVSSWVEKASAYCLNITRVGLIKVIDILIRAVIWKRMKLGARYCFFYESLRRSPATKSYCCCWVSILFGRGQKSFMLWMTKVHQRNHEGLSFLIKVTLLLSFLTHGQTKCTLSHGSNSHTGHVGWLNRPLSAMELWLWRGEWPQGWGPNLNCHTGLACLLLFPSLNKNSFVVNQDMSCLQSRQF